MKRLKNSILILICLAGIIPAKAQVDSTKMLRDTTVALRDSSFAVQRDSILAQADSTAVNDTTPHRRRQNSRDISHLALQKRYRPKDEPTGFGRVFSGMYVWGHGSFYLPFVRDYGYGPMAFGGIGKWFSDKKGLHRYHGVRIGAGGGYFMDNYEGQRVKMFAVNASYLFDLGAYVNGYTPKRIVSVVPVVGLGYTITEGASNGSGAMNAKGLSAHLGADLEFRLFPGIDLVVEPLLEFQQDPRKLVRQDIWRAYYPVLRGDVGLNVHLDRKYWSHLQDPGHDVRVSFSGGPRMQYAPALFYPENIGNIYSMMGWDIAAGVSRKYSKWFYLRLQASFAKDYWWLRTENLETGVHYSRQNATHIAGRMDAMIDILGMIPTRNDRERRVGLLLFAGPEVGLLHKDGIENVPDVLFNNQHPFIGAQGGLQFRVRVFKDWSVYLEPRVGIIPYYALSNNRETKLDSYSDLYGTVSMGVEYVLFRGNQLAIVKYRKPVQVSEDASGLKTQPVVPRGFFSGMYAWVQGSYFNPLVSYYSYGPMAAVGVGKWFSSRDGMHRYHGVRLGMGGGYFFDRANPNHLHALNATASYLFNLTDYLRGYNPQRLFSVVPLAGLGVNFEETQRGNFKGLGLSGHIGADLNVQVFPGVEIVAEPLFEIHQDPRRPERGGLVRPVYTAFRGSMGLNVYLDRQNWNQNLDPGQDWRVSLSAGPRMIFASPDGTGTMGWDVAAGVSRKLNKWFYLRLQGGYARDGWQRPDKNGNPQRLNAKHLAGRADAMFDLLAMGSSSEEHKRRLGLLLFAGPEAGLMRHAKVNDIRGMHPFVGAQAGIQLKYDILDGLGLYLEPRVGIIPYHAKSSTAPDQYDSFADWYGTVSLGLEYVLVRGKQFVAPAVHWKTRQETPASRQEKTPSTVLPSSPRGFVSDMYVWAQGGFNEPLVQDYSYGSMAFAGVGKWFSGRDGLHRYHGVRLGVGTGYYFDKVGANHVKSVNGYASYMLDLTSLLHGFNPQRIISVAPLVGVGVGASEKQRGDYSGLALSAHLGADLNIQVFPGIEVVAEPLFEVHKDPRKPVRDDKVRDVYAAFRGNVGLNFYLDRKYWNQYPDQGRDWRVSLSAGPRMILASPDGTGTLGWDVAAGVSRKLNNWFYLRLQGGYARDGWQRPDKNGNPQRMSSQYIAGRADAMFDLLAMGSSSEEYKRRMGLLLFAGPEAGVLRNGKVNDIRGMHPYFGAQAGIQLKYDILDGLGLYLEPRVGIIPYHAKSSTTLDQYDSFADWYGTVSLGLEYTLGHGKQFFVTKQGSVAPAREKATRTRKEKTSDYGGFFRDTYVWALGGFNEPLVKDYSYGTMAMVGIGKWFTDRQGMRRQHGVRLGAGTGYYFDKVGANHIKSIMGYASYLFDVSSAVNGFDPDRFVSFVPLVGVGVGASEKQRGDFSGLGLSAHLGADLNVQVLPGLELVAEPLFELVSDPRKPVRDGKERSVYTAFRGSVGVNFHFDRKYWNKFSDPGRDWRVSLSGGARMLFSSQAAPVGWDVAAGVSRQFNDWFHLRLQGGYAVDGWLAEDKNGNLQRQNSKHIAGRVDAMFDMLGLMSSGSNSERRMGLLLFAGPEAGLMRNAKVNDIGRMHPFVGAQAGIQLKYEVLDGMSVYLEPRVGVIPYHTKSTAVPEQFDSFADWYGTVSLGIEYRLGWSTK